MKTLATRRRGLLALGLLGGTLATYAASSATTSSLATTNAGAPAATAAAGGDLTIGSFSTFTGANASFGLEQIAGCYTATSLIDKAGGILGHNVRCLAIDDRGDPADGVSAAAQAIATTSNLVGTLGPGGQATAVEPVFRKASITMLADSGDSAFNRTTDKYFWRITPPDSAGGYAMALWARQRGYTRGAAVFSESTTAQTSVPTLQAGFKKLGGTMVVSENLVPGAPSYQSEVARLLAAHPQVIFTEADPQTDATFLTALKQLNNGKVLPIIGTAPTYTPQWQQAVKAAIGASSLAANFVALQPDTPPVGTAYNIFKAALLGDRKQIPNPSQWAIDPYSMTDYDGVTIMALAMLKAKSTRPSVYNASIAAVTAAGAGKVVVYSFAQGKAALAKGKAIRYVGAGGAVNFNQWHNNNTPFSAAGYTASGGPRTVGIVSSSALAKLTG